MKSKESLPYHTTSTPVGSPALGMDSIRNMLKKQKQTNKKQMAKLNQETLQEMNNVIPSIVYKSRS